MWLSAERGRSPSTITRLPPRPPHLRRPGCATQGRAARRGDGGGPRRLRRARCASRDLAPASVARDAGARARRCTGSSPTRGGRPPIPAPTSSCPGCPRGAAQGAQRGGGRPAARRAGRATARSCSATGPCSRCSTAPACGCRSSSGCRIGDIDLDAALLRAFGKGSKERIVPIGVPRRPGPGARGSGPEGRPAMAPAQWRRRGDAEAVFLNARGGRLVPAGRLGRAAPLRRARSAWRAGSARTCSATPAPPTCSTTGPTSGPCRSCSATRRSAPRRCTRSCPPSGCGRCTASAHPRARARAVAWPDA